MNTIPQEIIDKAIQGGYEPHWLSGIHEHGIVLDPTFWQALGKSLGWEQGEWKQKAHIFIDIILNSESDDTIIYWQEILK